MYGMRIGTLFSALVAILRRCMGGQRPDAGLGMTLGENERIAWSLRQRLRFARIVFCPNSPFHRGLKLLLENLTPTQQSEFLRFGYFHVIGGKTGRLYRICKGRQVNVHELDANDRRICIWCFYPVGNLVEGDVMLAQKLALELFEEDALKAANRLSNFCEPMGT